MDLSVSASSARPFLKWAGGKWRLIDQYGPYLPEIGDNRYFEPFLGGGALFFHLQPDRAVLSDINEELITCYRVVRDHPFELVKRIVAHRRRHDSEYYYKIRASKPRNEINKAARFVYLNRTCFNGLWRVNSRGRFNVPIGRYKHPLARIESMIFSASKALQGRKIEVASFDRVLSLAKKGDVVYFDPPYQPLNATSSFTSYSKDNFDEDDQRRLAGVFAGLTRVGVKALLSNSDHPLIRGLYGNSGYRIVRIKARRNINSKATARGAIAELLILNY